MMQDVKQSPASFRAFYMVRLLEMMRDFKLFDIYGIPVNKYISVHDIRES